MQSFISGIIRLGQRQGFCRWNSAHFKASTRAFLPTQSSNSLIHETNDSISSENHLLQLLGTRIGSQTKELMSPSSSGGCLIPSLSRLAAMMSSSSSRYMTTAASPTMDSSESVTDVPTRIKFKRLDKTARHIMQIVDKEAVEEVKGQREIPEIKPGYIVQLKVEVPENKRRVSTIKGIVIARRNAGLNTTFRIRRMVAGVGVESLFPLYSPNIKEIKVLDKKKVRRAKLYYLRNKMNALR
ncbi:50S ribosomal protein L19-1, chloroplastic-like [Gossypium arboreum]|uniref:50S ribosomal protein L19-1, chloroplastic-like n=1 Tax=Gossypium arboreum TaxID=29729 RepID=UPI000819548B|nr:50S ribosomal protein L19-1, chloroplastic-like [Gossypium arboreum]